MRDWFDEFEVHGMHCRVVNDFELISARAEQLKAQVSQNRHGAWRSMKSAR